MRLDMGERVHEVIAKLVDALTQLAGKLFISRSKSQVSACVNEVTDRFSLRKINASIKKSAPRKFARLSTARATSQYSF